MIVGLNAVYSLSDKEKIFCILLDPRASLSWSEIELNLKPSEYINKIQGYHGQVFIEYLIFETNFG